MKNLLKLGKALNKAEQKMIQGGKANSDMCLSHRCSSNANCNQCPNTSFCIEGFCWYMA